jgi:putative Ca2+/H+ antiporter (TMEM165/GDT1 family)
VEAVRRRVSAVAPGLIMDAIWVSTGVVALAEIGDKTQLLAIVLAAKFRKPLPIILGILVATLLNHAAAAMLGYYVSQWLAGPTFRLVVGAAFVIMAAWALIPDRNDEGASNRSRGGVFITTTIAFFLVEIGDKTQIATSLLAAQYSDIVFVTIGTTLGMMLANVPAVFFGEAVTRVVPLKYVRIGAAVLFAVIGVWIILSALGLL